MIDLYDGAAVASINSDYINADLEIEALTKASTRSILKRINPPF